MAIKDSKQVEELLEDPSKIKEVRVDTHAVVLMLSDDTKITIFADDEYKLGYNVFQPR